MTMDAPSAFSWLSREPLTLKAGDLAVLAHPKSKHSQAWAGVTVVVSETHIAQNDPRLLERGLVAPAPSDYLVRYPDGSLGLVDAWQLEPAPPTPESRPDADRR